MSPQTFPHPMFPSRNTSSTSQKLRRAKLANRLQAESTRDAAQALSACNGCWNLNRSKQILGRPRPRFPSSHGSNGPQQQLEPPFSNGFFVITNFSHRLR